VSLVDSLAFPLRITDVTTFSPHFSPKLDFFWFGGKAVERESRSSMSVVAVRESTLDHLEKLSGTLILRTQVSE